MADPVNPDSPPPPSQNPSPSAGGSASAYPTQGKAPEYSQAWAKMLPGATPAQVQLFMQGVLKALNLTIQQDQVTAARAARKMKRAIEENG